MRYGIWSVILPIKIGQEFTVKYAEGAQILSLHMDDNAIGPWMYLWGDMDSDTAPLEEHRFVWQGIGDNTVYKPWKWDYRGTIHTTSLMLFLFEY